jgi:shikimate dehydrogenase
MITPPLTALIGWPVAHSKSPKLHATWMQQCNIIGHYNAIAVAPETLVDWLRALPASGLIGVNVTVPHKETVFAWCAQTDVTAKKIGAVNTLYRDAAGAWCGTNTDAFGFMENIRNVTTNITPYLPHAVVLGAGGAARAVLVALLEAGVKRITLVNRTQEKAVQLARFMGETIHVATWEDREKILADASMLINTTSLGMQQKEPLVLDLQALPTRALVNDLVYAPLETPLLAAARARGNVVVDGLGMLIYQAQQSFACWHGITPKVTPELRAYICA